jgi:hypothetical protein
MVPRAARECVHSPPEGFEGNLKVQIFFKEITGRMTELDEQLDFEFAKLEGIEGDYNEVTPGAYQYYLMRQS